MLNNDKMVIDGNMVNDGNFTQTFQLIQDLVKDSKIEFFVNITKTGNTFKSLPNNGKRLLKLVKVKNGVKIEFNCNFDQEIENLPYVGKISKDLAKCKHMGTMKYLVKLPYFDKEIIGKLVKNQIKWFELEIMEMYGNSSNNMENLQEMENNQEMENE